MIHIDVADASSPAVLTKAQKRRFRLKTAKKANKQRLLDAAKKGEGELWKTLREFGDPVAERPALGAYDLLPVFDIRMNSQPQDPVPGEDPIHRRLVLAEAALLPKHTLDLTPERFFSRPWSQSDIEDIKLRIQAHPEDSASGWDEQSYGFAMTLQNTRLLELYNLALYSTSTPGQWLTTLLVGVLKRGKDGTVPQNYRTIGLECILLKMLTLLIDKRVREWEKARGILPRSQNGFRPTYRTNNNAFILRCAAERAQAQGKTLYVASVDLTNAFPSVDRPLLWLKLHRLGMGGPVFDLYRHIYDEMTYIVRMADGYSEGFTSDIGVLIGDPASPIMWDIFFADFELAPHDDDITLCGQPVSHLEHADDVLIMSTSPEGLQLHLEGLAKWGAGSFVRVNTGKTWAYLAGVPSGEPFVFLNGDHVTFRDSATYVGMHIGGGDRRIFRAHYTEQAKKARRTAAVCFAVEGLLGALPIDIARKIYKSRVESHLISGADVCPDATEEPLHELEVQQIYFLRRLLGLGSRSMITPLFSETDILPIRYRRADLTLRYLEYCMGRGDNELVHLAMRDSMGLAGLGCLSWYGDLQTAVGKYGIIVPGHATIRREDVAAIRDNLRTTMLHDIDTEFAGSPKLSLLCGTRANGTVGRYRATTAIRPYLHVEKKKYRVALTRLLLSNHDLAVEALRHKSRYRGRIDRQFRLCRFCQGEIEDELHALFECEDNAALLVARETFRSTLERVGYTEDILSWKDRGQLLRALQTLAHNKEFASPLARLAYDVLEVFGSAPMYVHNDL